MGLTVLDSSVLIAVWDDGDALHPAAVAAVAEVASDRLVLPASAYAEILVGALRADRADDMRARLAALEVGVEPLSREMAEAAAKLRTDHPTLRLADALILGTAKVLGAERILTGDARWPHFSSLARVISPGR